ncbi:hypothetical protein CDAR_524791 [Caerostris darwini]|uniref:Uncharacterized protein n=1 Tax=Caerostris darwini TaxID=1538125 RepID=A0AAV4QWK3_9ARAC|nr:hypothetical protein CDAR_524791 [Caerostris darwini]
MESNPCSKVSMFQIKFCKVLLNHPSGRPGSTPDKSVKKSSTSDECESGMTALRNARRSASLASRSSALSPSPSVLGAGEESISK